MIDYNQLASLVCTEKEIWVRLHDGLKICLIDILEGETFIAKFLPCAENARKYEIEYNEIKEIIEKEK